MTAKVYHRTLIQIEVLSAYDIGELSFENILRDGQDGDLSIDINTVAYEEVDEAAIGRLLIQQRSDPEFLIDPCGDDDIRHCPCCGEPGSPVDDPDIQDEHSYLYCCSDEDCEDLWTVPRFDTEITRPIEFLLVNDAGDWETEIMQVPVQVRWSGMQQWASDNVAGKGCYRKCLRIIPWNECPED